MKRRYKRYYTDRQIYQGDNYLDVQIFPVFNKPRKGAKRGRKTNPTAQMQKKLNDNNAENKLIRLANNNFSDEDYALHLTYDDEHLPQTTQQAERDMQNYLRRLKRVYKKIGIELKYIWTAAKGKKSDRPHFHCILSGGAARESLEKLWGKGYAHTTMLRFGKEGIAGFAIYFCRQEKLLYRSWSCSKNLKRPEKEDYRISADKVGEFFEEYQNCYNYSEFEKHYPGYETAYITAVKNDIVGGIYIFARLCRKSGDYCSSFEESQAYESFWDG